ncbi:hypothetical protein OFR27_05480 [Brachyspira hyodysenteriae]|nr:hypothetical protein [Brachyspira hyodysenteriae]MDA0034578.1 hypothetical protein [Brachyspira hyodysenteriae]
MLGKFQKNYFWVNFSLCVSFYIFGVSFLVSLFLWLDIQPHTLRVLPSVAYIVLAVMVSDTVRKAPTASSALAMRVVQMASLLGWESRFFRSLKKIYIFGLVLLKMFV